jgi:hypothetical protein
MRRGKVLIKDTVNQLLGMGLIIVLISVLSYTCINIMYLHDINITRRRSIIDYDK